MFKYLLNEMKALRKSLVVGVIATMVFLSIIFLGGLFFTIGYSYNEKLTEEKDEELLESYTVKADTFALKSIEFYNKTPEDGLMEALEYFDIKHKEIVYAQAVLETGSFTSYNCKHRNNLFGLYNSRKGEYFSFNHWVDCVIAYKIYIQRRYNGKENYYAFLDRIGYAEAKHYNQALQHLVKAHKDKK